MGIGRIEFFNRIPEYISAPGAGSLPISFSGKCSRCKVFPISVQMATFVCGIRFFGLAASALPERISALCAGGCYYSFCKDMLMASRGAGCGSRLRLGRLCGRGGCLRDFGNGGSFSFLASAASHATRPMQSIPTIPATNIFCIRFSIVCILLSCDSSFAGRFFYPAHSFCSCLYRICLLVQ